MTVKLTDKENIRLLLLEEQLLKHFDNKIIFNIEADGNKENADYYKVTFTKDYKLVSFFIKKDLTNFENVLAHTEFLLNNLGDKEWK